MQFEIVAIHLVHHCLLQRSVKVLELRLAFVGLAGSQLLRLGKGQIVVELVLGGTNR